MLENEIRQMRKDRNKCIIGEHNKKEQPAEKKRKLENSRWVTVRQNETIPHTMRSCEIEQEEKKWEETAGKNKKMRDSNTIKKQVELSRATLEFSINSSNKA